MRGGVRRGLVGISFDERGARAVFGFGCRGDGGVGGRLGEDSFGGGLKGEGEEEEMTECDGDGGGGGDVNGGRIVRSASEMNCRIVTPGQEAEMGGGEVVERLKWNRKRARKNYA